MTAIRAQCSWQIDSANPTDVLVITPHFKVVGGPLFPSADYDSLANDLATALDTYTALHTQLTVKLYDAEAAAPNFPKATKTVRQATIASSPSNRDLALCLSYYSDVNRPRHRGRLYIPCPLIAINGGAATATPANLVTVSNIVPIFTGLGGINVDWVVWSRVDRVSRPVTDWYVDNSWDTQRRRGGKASNRLTGTTSEGSAPNLVALQTPPATDDGQVPAA
jgi:hypothetical protein